MWQLYVGLAIIFFGLNDFTVKKIKKAKPEQILFFQFISASFLAFIATIIFGQTSKINFFHMFLGIGLFLALMFFYLALKLGELSKVAPIFGLNVIITAILGLIFLSEPFSAKTITGLILGTLGIYFLGGKK
ncbi:MAG: EamA family transporter [Candidatus Nanoarchaeia archaeon]|nr:EamA family transporter [Candidatus Nanoarchaeia archaeon]